MFMLFHPPQRPECVWSPLSFLHKRLPWAHSPVVKTPDRSADQSFYCPKWRIFELGMQLCLFCWLHLFNVSDVKWTEVNLRPTASRPVCSVVMCPSGTRDPFLFLLEISFRPLQLWYFVAPFLTRGLVCSLLCNWFWALPEQSPLGRSPVELTAIFYYIIWNSLNLEGQVPIFISPRNRVAQL
jgi:hypothetical protein